MISLNTHLKIESKITRYILSRSLESTVICTGFLSLSSKVISNQLYSHATALCGANLMVYPPFTGTLSLPPRLISTVLPCQSCSNRSGTVWRKWRVAILCISSTIPRVSIQFSKTSGFCRIISRITHWTIAACNTILSCTCWAVDCVSYPVPHDQSSLFHGIPHRLSVPHRLDAIHSKVIK